MRYTELTKKELQREYTKLTGAIPILCESRWSWI